jgi:hypothetical protein
MTSTELTREQREILHHTKWRAANQAYCGAIDDPDLIALCDAGLMRYVGTRSWLPKTEGYFVITSNGIRALKS